MLSENGFKHHLNNIAHSTSMHQTYGFDEHLISVENSKQVLLDAFIEQNEKIELFKESLNYNEVFQFMKDFEIDVLNRFDELIIDIPTNTWANIKGCKDIEDVKTRVVYSLCRPIGKGLDERPANRLLDKFNRYFGVDLTREDMLLVYQELCYTSKFDEFKDFIRRGFPMNELVN